MDAIQITNLVYVIIMFASAGLFFYLSTIWKQVPKYFFLLHIGVTTWSGIMYLNLVVGEPFPDIARYLDWVISTPLLLLALGLSAMYLGKIKASSLILAASAQVIIILTGLFADISESDFARNTWFILGTLLLVDIAYYIWVEFAQISKKRANKELHSKYLNLATFFTIQWLLYPIVWIIGSTGLAIFDVLTTNILLVILPIISKAGFGLLDLYLLNSYHKPKSTKEKVIVVEQITYAG